MENRKREQKFGRWAELHRTKEEQHPGGRHLGFLNGDWLLVAFSGWKQRSGLGSLGRKRKDCAENGLTLSADGRREEMVCGADDLVGQN